MNRLPGTVTAIETEGDVSLVEVAALGHRFTAVVLESAATSAYLAPGRDVTVLFKESEVALATGSPAGLAGLSIRNRLPCAVTAIHAGRILSHVELACGDSPLHALITTRALRDLGLRPGAEVLALVKSTEVSLAEGHAAP